MPSPRRAVARRVLLERSSVIRVVAQGEDGRVREAVEDVRCRLVLTGRPARGDVTCTDEHRTGRGEGVGRAEAGVACRVRLLGLRGVRAEREGRRGADRVRAAVCGRDQCPDWRPPGGRTAVDLDGDGGRVTGCGAGVTGEARGRVARRAAVCRRREGDSGWLVVVEGHLERVGRAEAGVACRVRLLGLRGVRAEREGRRGVDRVRAAVCGRDQCPDWRPPGGRTAVDLDGDGGRVTGCGAGDTGEARGRVARRAAVCGRGQRDTGGRRVGERCVAMRLDARERERARIEGDLVDLSVEVRVAADLADLQRSRIRDVAGGGAGRRPGVSAVDVEHESDVSVVDNCHVVPGAVVDPRRAVSLQGDGAVVELRPQRPDVPGIVGDGDLPVRARGLLARDQTLSVDRRLDPRLDCEVTAAGVEDPARGVSHPDEIVDAVELRSRARVACDRAHHPQRDTALIRARDRVRRLVVGARLARFPQAPVPGGCVSQDLGAVGKRGTVPAGGGQQERRRWHTRLRPTRRSGDAPSVGAWGTALCRPLLTGRRLRRDGVAAIPPLACARESPPPARLCQ